MRIFPARFLLTVGLFVFCISAHPLTASGQQDENTPSRAEQQISARFAAIRASDVSDEEKCQQIWSYNWQLQKEGNLNARYDAYYGLVHGWFFIQGRPQDRLLASRDSSIYEFHAFGSATMQKDMGSKTPQELWESITMFRPIFARNTALETCVLDKGLDQACTQIAVQEGLIPSFAEFAAEIDMFLANGAHFVCPKNAR